MHHKGTELEKTEIFAAPCTVLGTAKAVERPKLVLAHTQKLVFDHKSAAPTQREPKRIVAEAPHHQRHPTDYQACVAAGYYINATNINPNSNAAATTANTNNKAVIRPEKIVHVEDVSPARRTNANPPTAQQEKKKQLNAAVVIPPADSQAPHAEPVNVSGVIDNGLLDNFTIGKQVGQGAYAAVKVAIHKKLNKKVALKIYDKMKLVEPQRQKSVQREIKIMQRLSHENIVKFYEAVDTAKQVIVAMEYIRGISLNGYLKLKPGRRLPEQEAKKLFKQVVAGVGYCHGKSITHRDIKLENILLDEANNIKIIDFGFSTCIPNTRKIKIFCGTPSYMAPEIVSRKEYAGPPADIWALGVLLYAMLCGTFPFKGDSDKELYRKINRGYFDVPEHLSTMSKALLLRILQVDPDKRPTAEQISLDLWLNSTSDTISRPLSCRRQEDHPERSYSHDPLQCARAANKETQHGAKPHKAEPELATGRIVSNGPAHVKESPANITKTAEVNKPLDNDIVNSIIRLGYTSSEVAQQMLNDKSHIFILYNKIKEQRDKQQNIAAQTKHAPCIWSLGHSRQNSIPMKSRPCLIGDKDYEKQSFGSARGKLIAQKNLVFNTTSPFVLGDH